jgi:hypothetical protein
MPLAQIIRFDERQAVDRPRRVLEKPSACIILRFTRFPTYAPATLALPKPTNDEDRVAGRGRDPG